MYFSNTHIAFPALVLLGLLAACISPTAGTAPWTCSREATAGHVDAALNAFYILSGRQNFDFRIENDPLGEDSTCGIPHWLANPPAAGFAFKKACWQPRWTSADHSRSTWLRNYTIELTDSCKRPLRGHIALYVRQCTAEFAPNITGPGPLDPWLQPVGRVIKFKQVPLNSSFPGDKCPPDAPYLIHRHNPHDSPVFMTFYTEFLPVLRRVWWPRQRPKPFYWPGVYVSIGEPGFFGCTDGQGRLVAYSSVELAKWAPGGPGPWEPGTPVWRRTFFINATTLDFWQCGTTLVDTRFELVKDTNA